MYLIKVIIISCLVCAHILSFSQEADSLKNDTNNRTYFYHDNGKVASVGYLVNGRPDGFWQTFHKNGVLKSQGNRKNFLLDGLWTFYNEEGELILKINYKNDLKHGIRKTYTDRKIIEEHFENDVLHGPLKHLYLDGNLKKTATYQNGKLHGIAKEYSTEGIVIVLTEYRNGHIVSRENINRTDRHNNKQGTWKYFYEHGNIKKEGFYVNNQKNGFFKTYRKDGSLLEIKKYVNGILQEDAPELARYETRTNYYPDGSVRIRASYRDGVADGIRREFDPNGNVTASYIFKDGVIIAEGIIDREGNRQGFWKHFYEDGNAIESKGNYANGQKVGQWKYFNEDTSLKQKGHYNNNGFQNGKWFWYYEDGALQKTENFRNGKRDGLTVEYDREGNVIAKGQYVDGYEDGFWFYVINNYRREGEFSYGRKIGEWKTYYDNGELKFRGSFIDDYPDGRHFYYWDNGRLKEERNFAVGMPQGVWRKFTKEGILALYIDHRRGIEYRYNGVLIEPELDN